MSCTATKNRELMECYCAGTKREQSKIIFEECKLMLRNSPLSLKFDIRANKIIHKKTKSFITPLSKEDGKSGDGTNCGVLVLDEYHQHKTTEFYDLFLGANAKESILMIITTAGMDLTYPCFTQEYQYASDILFGKEFNEEYFTDILEIDEEDDYYDFNCWYKANPVRMTYPEGIEKIPSSLRLT